MAVAEAGGKEGCQPPLLSWKGLQSWSVGCRATSVCEMFLGFNGKKLGKLILNGCCSKKEGKKKKQCSRSRTTMPDVKEKLESEDDERKLGLSSWVPTRHSCSAICDQPKSSSDVEQCGFQWRQSCDGTWVPRRPSDASVSSFFSVRPPGLSSCSGSYERVWLLKGGDVDCMLPDVKLGGISSRRSDASTFCTAELSHEDSGSSSSNRRSSSFSATEVATGGGRGRRSGAAASAATLLFQANQCLTHLTVAAPLPTTIQNRQYTPHMHPSDGLLRDASVRCRDAELKDRIILFL